MPLVERIITECREPVCDAREQVVEVILVFALVEPTAALLELIRLVVALGL